MLLLLMADKMIVKYLLGLAVISGCCIFQISCDRCPLGFVRNGRSCYWFSTTKGTFGDARSMCRYFRSNLVKIENQKEDTFIRRYAMHRGKGNEYLLGGTDLMLEGRWSWEGEEKEMVYKNFSPGQPDNAGRREHCLGIRRDFQGFKWNDIPCDRPYHYICERSVI